MGGEERITKALSAVSAHDIVVESKEFLNGLVGGGLKFRRSGPSEGDLPEGHNLTVASAFPLDPIELAGGHSREC